jgi:electron transfer flavoprotein alpha subunit
VTVESEAATIEALARMISESTPTAALTPSTYGAREVAARLAARLDSGLIAVAVGVESVADVRVAEQSVLAGTCLVKSTVVRGTPIISVRPDITTAEPAEVVPDAVRVDVGDSAAMNAASVLSRLPRQYGGHPDLTGGADAVVGEG